MKKYIFLILLAVLSFGLHAQKDVTTFLGIPVEGTRQEMIDELKALGFTYNSDKGYLRGWFNDEEVFINIITQNRRVVEIRVTDVKNRTNFDIISRFNDLVCQFERNSNYPNTWKNQKIGGVIRSNSDPSGCKAMFFQKDRKYYVADRNKPVWFEIKKTKGIHIISNSTYFI